MMCYHPRKLIMCEDKEIQDALKLSRSLFSEKVLPREEQCGFLKLLIH